MSRSRRRVLVRVLGMLGVLTQLLVGLMAILLFPAAFVALLAGVAGVRQVARDLDAASMRLGIALATSLVGLLFGLVSGAPWMAATAAVSTGSFGAAWWLVQRLGQTERAAFGIRHRDWERRDAELRRRRDDLQQGRSAQGPPPAAQDDPDAWLQEFE